MKIIYIGSGFVGACSAAVMADSGHEVLVYDIDQRKIDLLSSGDRDKVESCLFEDGLGDMIVRNGNRLKFTTDFGLLEALLDEVDAVFMCLPTPEKDETGESDLQYYESAANKLSQVLAKRNGGKQTKHVVIVNKSTVPIATVDLTEKIMDKVGVKNYGVVSNPEFLVEGKAIAGTLRPDRIVVGANSEEDFAVMRGVYQRFYDSPSVEYIEVNPKEAAAGKLLANFYLFNKLAVCFDVIGRTAEKFPGVKFENLRRIIATDKRLGDWGLYDSLYAGGSCFIKDTRSLSYQLKERGEKASLVGEVYSANRRQLDNFLARAETEAKISWSGKTVALLGTAFKRDTNDIRNSPSIEIVKVLLAKGIGKIQIYDPAALGFFKIIYPASDVIVYAESEAGALNNADVVIVATDWPQFRGVGDILLNSSNRPLIMDGRRMLQHKYNELQAVGFDIVAVGSPFLKAKS